MWAIEVFNVFCIDLSIPVAVGKTIPTAIEFINLSAKQECQYFQLHFSCAIRNGLNQ